MNIIYILATIFGIIGGLANLPQVIKIFKRKSAKDISILTYAIIFLGTIVWILYGIQIRDMPILVGNIFGAITVSLVIFGWFLYGRSKK